MLYWWPGWLICLEHEAIDVDDKVVGHSEFPTFFLACWLVDWLHVTLNRKLGFFRYALIIGPLTSSFLRLHISYTRVTIRAPLGRGFAASRSVAIKGDWKIISVGRRDSLMYHLQAFGRCLCPFSVKIKQETKSGVHAKITNHKIDLWRQRLFDGCFLITIVQTLNIALHEHYQWKAVVTVTFCIGGFKGWKT